MEIRAAYLGGFALFVVVLLGVVVQPYSVSSAQAQSVADGGYVALGTTTTGKNNQASTAWFIDTITKKIFICTGIGITDIQCNSKPL